MQRQLPATIPAILSHVTDKFIEEVIKEVRESFVSGYTLLNMRWSFQKEDSSFEWDANRIERTRFTAGKGPRRPSEMTTFLKDTVFHPFFPVSQIVAFGSCLGNDPSVAGVDFCHYPVRGFETLEGYKVDIKSVSGEFALSPDGKQVYPDSVVESLLTVTHPDTGEMRKLRVTLFGLKDNDSFHLAGGQQKTDEGKMDGSCEVQKKVLSELIQRSFTKWTFVHCKSGYGRTGHFIAMVEIVKKYERIFASKDAKVVAGNILSMVERIRKNRAYLLLVPEQMDNAIRNAKVLYQYGLNNRCVQVKGLSNTASVVARLTQLAEQRATQEEKKSIPPSSDQMVPDIYRTENSRNAALFDSVNSSSQEAPEIQIPAPQFPTPTPGAG